MGFAYSVREASASFWVAAGGILTSSAVVALMLYRAVALPDGTSSFVMPEPGWLVLIAGVACLVLSIAMLAYMRHLSPAPPALPSPLEGAASTSSASPQAASPPEPTPEVELVGLKEDERRLYDMIVDRGGEVLQRDLVASGEFSKAKVTRLLDKLEGRELIKRERHGMTNMVKLVR